MAVANAVEQVRAAAAYVTTAPGAHAAREAIEHVLLAQGLWESVCRTVRHVRARPHQRPMRSVVMLRVGV
jgi:hypothetical protein